MIPSTTSRVPRHTRDRYNRNIRRETQERVERLCRGSAEDIDRRLEELD